MQRKTNSHQTNTKSGGIVWANTNMCGIRNANTEAKQLKDAYILQSSYVGGQYPKRRSGGITKFMWLVIINNVVHSQYLMNQLSILTIASETGIWNSRSHVEKGEVQQQGCQRSHFPARGWSVLWACRRTSELGPYWEPSGSVLITNHIHQKDTFSNSSDSSLQ